MSGNEPTLGASDFGFSDDWRGGVEKPELEQPEEKHAHAAQNTQMVHRRNHVLKAGGIRGDEWQMGFEDPTEGHPFLVMAWNKTAASKKDSDTHAKVWCETMNDSLQLDYQSYRGNVLSQCLLSFKPGVMDEKNRHIWGIVQEFASLNRAFIVEVSKQQAKLNHAMARIGSTAHRCSDQIENMMDIPMAVAPFEDAVKDLKNQNDDLGAKNHKLNKDFAILAAKLDSAIIGDAGVQVARESLKNSVKDLTEAREKYLEKYEELNLKVTEHKARLKQLEQQLKDMKYSSALISEHAKLLDDQTIDSEKHRFKMAKLETQAHDYFYEEKCGDEIVFSEKIFREGIASKKARRSEALQQLMREDSQSALRKLGKHKAAMNELHQEYTIEKGKWEQAELAMETTLKQLERDYVAKNDIYEHNLGALQAATKHTGVVRSNLDLFLKAFQQITYYNTDVQKSTDKILIRLQTISDDLETGLRDYRKWNKPLSKHKPFDDKLKDMVKILNDEGITEFGDLAPFGDERNMERLMEAILPNLRRNHSKLIEIDGKCLRMGFKNAFEKICKQMAAISAYLLSTTKDIGGYLSTSFSAFNRGQRLIKKPTTQSLRQELDKIEFLPGIKQLAIKDSPADEHKHDIPSSDKPKPKRKSAKDRFVK